VAAAGGGQRIRGRRLRRRSIRPGAAGVRRTKDQRLAPAAPHPSLVSTRSRCQVQRGLRAHSCRDADSARLAQESHRRRPSPGTRTVATTSSRCTSRPAHRSTITSIFCSLPKRPFTGGNLPRMSLSYALEAAINGSTGPRATLLHGLSRTKPRRRRSGQPYAKDSHPSQAAAGRQGRCRAHRSGS
jgi:hypothetical protein